MHRYYRECIKFVCYKNALYLVFTSVDSKTKTKVNYLISSTLRILQIISIPDLIKTEIDRNRFVVNGKVFKKQTKMTGGLKSLL